MPRTPSDPPVDQYKRICKCGHDRSNHHPDRERVYVQRSDGSFGQEPIGPPFYGTCLARGCDTCRRYQGP